VRCFGAVTEARIASGGLPRRFRRKPTVNLSNIAQGRFQFCSAEAFIARCRLIQYRMAGVGDLRFKV
jgi:hypothetical protein